MMKTSSTLLVLFLLASQITFAQSLDKVIVTTTDPDNLYMASDVDSNSLFYLKLVPVDKPKGVLVILPGAFELVRMIPSQITLHKLAVDNNLIVVFPSLNYGISNHDKEHKFLDVVFKQISEQYNVPKDKFILGGFSGGGMIALSYTEKANRDKNSTYLVPKAVFGIDPPLDYAHLWNHAERDVERNFSDVAVQEGKWIMDTYKRAFGGSPDEFKDNYVKHSIYSHSEKNGGNAQYLKNTPILIYTEPDVIWQMENRRRDAYDMNSTDISAMINLLKLQGNEDATMITTQNKGVRQGGAKHPHSWSIMDSEESMAWVLKQLAK